MPPGKRSGDSVAGLRADLDMDIRIGMSFHIPIGPTGMGKGSDFICGTVPRAPTGADALKTAPLGSNIRQD